MSDISRLMEKVYKDSSGCWLWKAHVRPDGYAAFWYNGGAKTAHRVSYSLHVGPIPDGLHLDHLCRVRNCVNPDHLEPVTKLENTLRGLSPAVLNSRKQVCDNGHPFTEENTYVYGGYRQCRQCARRNKRDYKLRQRARRLAEQGGRK